MSSLTVKNRAQSLFPDGLQDSMILRNDGPYTVYVDNDATVNASAHAIPPTGTMAWDSTRPLFVSLDPELSDDVSSTLTIVRNSQPAQFGNKIDNVLLAVAFQNTYTSERIECGAYESLQIRLQCADIVVAYGAAYTVNDIYYSAIEWYDSSGQSMGIFNLDIPPYWDTVFSTDTSWSRVNVPVLGTFFNLLVQTNAPVKNIKMRVVGSTRNLRPGMAMGRYDTNIHGVNGALNSAASGWYGADRSVGIECATPLANVNFYIPNLGPHLRVSVYSTVTGGTNGLLRAYSVLQSNVRYTPGDAISANPQTFEYVMPLYEPILMSITPRSNAGVYSPTYVNLTWYD